MKRRGWRPAHTHEGEQSCLKKEDLRGCLHGRKEDPRRRNNFTLGLHAEISVRVVPKKRRFETELKMAGDKNKNAIWAPLLSLLRLISTLQ